MARFNKGWVKAWRDMVDGDLPQNIWLWGIWNWLLLRATWKPSKILWNGKQREIPPGTVVMGLGELATKWECSRMTIKRWLTYLEETQRVSLETCTRGTIVTIRNWDTYQSKDDFDVTPSVHELDADCTPTGHELALSKESKKGKRKESKNINPGIRTEYPEEFDQLWVLYERKGDKKASFEEFTRLNLVDEEEQTLEKAIRNYVKAQPEKKYRKDFERFLKIDWRELADAESMDDSYWRQVFGEDQAS